MTEVRHNLTVVIYPAPDVAGTWVAHCLELDLVTCGDSPVQAREMMDEALRLVANERIAMGLPPFEFRSAPSEDWDRLEGSETVAQGFMRFEGRSVADEVTVTPYVSRAS